MKKTILAFVLPALFAFGCDDTGNNPQNDLGGNDMAVEGDGGAMPDLVPGTDGGGTPAAPQIGDQIDRMGRGTINVAVTNPFDLTLPNGDRNATRDKYNQDADPSKWVANWSAQLQTNLAIYDGADGVCGNQAFACGMLTGCGNATAMADRYQTLASVLADDRLYLDTSKATCGTVYLARELALGGLETMDCGGRTPTATEDVVDYTYTAATTGASGFMGQPPNFTFAVTDGVVDSDGTNVSLTNFPFLDEPNP